MKKIAVPATKDNQIDNHFGHCQYYSIFTISDKGEILSVEKMDSPQGCGCKSNIASILAENGVSVMLAGGIGVGAINVLANSGINVIRGCEGDINDLIKSFISGGLIDSGEVCSSHHECSH